MCGVTIVYHNDCGYTTYDSHICARSPIYSPRTQPGAQAYLCPYNTTDSDSWYHPCPLCLRWASLAERNRLEMVELRCEQEMARQRKRQICLRRSTMWQSQRPMQLRASSSAPQAARFPGLPQRAGLGFSLSPQTTIRTWAPWTPQPEAFGDGVNCCRHSPLAVREQTDLTVL